MLLTFETGPADQSLFLSKWLIIIEMTFKNRLVCYCINRLSATLFSF
jgi:hypothetical protein